MSAEQQQLFAQVENAVASLKSVHRETREELNAARQRAEQQQQLNAQAASAAQQLLFAQVENAVASLKAIHRETCEELKKARQQVEQQQLIAQVSRESERRARRRERHVLSRLARGTTKRRLAIYFFFSVWILILSMAARRRRR